MNFLLSGALTYSLAGDTVRIDAGRLAVFWAAAPHQVTAIEGRGRFYWITLPAAWLFQWGLPAWFLEELLRGRAFIREPDPVDEARLSGWRRLIESGHPERHRIAQLEIEAALRRIALETAPDMKRARRPARRTAGGDHVQRITSIIAQRYTEDISVDALARAVGLHPKYAMTVFRQVCGISIGDYLLEMRLFHARRLLTASDAKIVDVAFASGFGSQSRFYEAFEKRVGCTPTAYRTRFR